MGTLFVVATPIGNLNDMTKRAIDTLKDADYILAEDTRQTLKLLNYFEIKNKLISYHKFNEEKKSNSIIDDLIEGKNIALVSDAGTPCISDPGYIIVKKARENNINVLTIPGCSAIIAALATGGLDTSSFAFYGFVPIEKKSKKELFDKIKRSDVKTKIVYESPKRILNFLSELKEEIPSSFVCVCSELTKVHEKYFYGIVNDVYNEINKDINNQKGEFVILISNEKENIKEDNISIESLILNEIINNNCSIKDAVNSLNNKNKNLSKKDIYNAGINLKNIMSKIK